MAIVRAAHHSRFTVLADSIMKDSRLSLREIGLLAVMLALPDDWKFSIAGLASICKDGQSAVRKAVQTLEACGYVVRTTGKDPKTNLHRVEYIVYEEPISRSSASRPFEIRTLETRPVENSTLYHTEQQNTEQSNTEQPNTEPSDAVPGANTVKQKQGAKGTGEGTVSKRLTAPAGTAEASSEANTPEAGAGRQIEKTDAVTKPYVPPNRGGALPGPHAPQSRAKSAPQGSDRTVRTPRKTSAFARAEEVKWRALLESYAPPEGF